MKEVIVAILPPLINQIGEGIREFITERREREKCEHGRPGGRLCNQCFNERNAKVEDD